MIMGNISVVGLTVSVLLYPVVMRFLAVTVQPKRIEMARIGQKLVGSDCLSTEYKLSVVSMLRDAFDFWVTIRMAVGFPVFVLSALLGSNRARQNHISDPDTLADFERFVSLFIISMLAANPLFGTICFVEALLCVLFILVKRLFSNTSVGISAAVSTAAELFARAEIRKRVSHHPA